ncbi:MAG: response regulator [Verrucomicrobia bacterium]|nr:response regulator [Verrucomicrobiota bacterium]
MELTFDSMPGSPPFLLNIKIVVVDDNPDIRLLIARFLAEHGAQVFSAKNAIEGLRLVREIHPNVVLSDLAMPGRNGFELLADIRSLDRYAGGSVPVVAMTAHKHERDLIVGIGFQELLEKPFSPDQLLATIDSALPS